MHGFSVRWVEISSLISVAGVAFDEPLDLTGLPVGKPLKETPSVKVPEQTR